MPLTLIMGCLIYLRNQFLCLFKVNYLKVNIYIFLIKIQVIFSLSLSLLEYMCIEIKELFSLTIGKGYYNWLLLQSIYGSVSYICNTVSLSIR